MTALLDTPSRVLRRVQEYEDMELPSLPSFQHELDSDMSTNEWGRNSAPSLSCDSLDGANDVSASSAHRSGYTESTARAASQPLGSSVPTPFPQRSSVQPKQGLESLDMSGPSIGRHDLNTQYDEDADFRASPRKVLEQSEEWDQSLSARLPASAHFAAPNKFEEQSESIAQEPTFDYDASLSATPIARHAVPSVVYPQSTPMTFTDDAKLGGTDSRIPSLSRSEISVTDNEATTPEGPERFQDSLDAPTLEAMPTEEYDATASRTVATVMLEDIEPSPAKSTPAARNRHAVTPAAIRYMDMPSTAARAAATPLGLGGPLRDITAAYRNPIPSTPALSTISDYNSTPRAALNDAERRKTHVLSVLASSKLPSRVLKRDIPHSRRRVSIAPDTDAIVEERSPGGTEIAHEPLDDSMSPNQSFISIASSQDLTSDRRGSRIYTQRGNTSVPNILIGNTLSTPALNLESRPDGNKIHKHLNMMNQQLLDANAELAQEATDWKDQCLRARDILREVGVELDDEGEPVSDLPRLRDSLSASLRQGDDSATAETLRRKDSTIARLEDQLAVMRAEQLNHLDMIRSKDDEAELARVDFARKTEEHASLFTTISGEFQANIESLNAKLAQKSTTAQEALDSKTAAEAKCEDLISLVDQLEQTIALHEQELVATRESIKQCTHDADILAGDASEARAELATVQEQLEDARGSLADTLVELELLRNKTEVSHLEKSLADESKVDGGPDNSLVIALEDRLDDAYREIGRLKGELGASPTRKSTLDTCNARIKALEAEKLSLLERIQARPPTPQRSMLTSTPIVHKSLAALRTPLTPGPLKDLSWLQTTVGDSNESMLRAQLDHLQQELEVVNGQLDRNFGRLEEAGLGAVQLAEKLANANDRIAQLEEQCRQLAREGKKSLASLNLGRNTNDHLESALEAVHEQMDALKGDMLSERERLQDENRRLRVVAADIRTKFDDELESVNIEMARIRREADEKLADAEDTLARLRNEKDTLESKQSLSSRTIERLERTISQLKENAGAEAEQHDRLVKNTASINAEHQTTIRSLQDGLRQAQELEEDLRGQLRQRSWEVEDANRRAEGLKAERARVAAELAVFGDDLAVQRSECVKFGSELNAFRREQASTTAAHSKDSANLEESLRRTRERLAEATLQVEDARRRCFQMQDKLATAESEARDASEEQKQKFKGQMRRLSAQIEYLKAKYTRENTFRNALSLQKKFLLLLVGGMSLNEQATLRTIASMGYERPAREPPRRSLKSVGLAIVALIRVKRMAQEWHATTMTRSLAVTRKERPVSTWV